MKNNIFIKGEKMKKSKKLKSIPISKMELSEEDVEKLSKILEDLENELIFSLGKRSGTFAETEIFDYDEDYIDVYAKFGIQDGESDVTYTEQYKIDRKKWEVVD
jgi:hypothetical protein